MEKAGEIPQKLLQKLRRLNSSILPPDRFQQSASMWFSLFEEVYYVAKHTVDTSVGFSGKLLFDSDYHDRRLSQYEGQGRLVVMVTGYMQSQLSYQRLERHLSHSGFDAFTYVWSDFPYSQDITLSAQQLAGRLRQIHKRAPAPEIYLLGHSQGGIIIRTLVQNHLADELPIRKCIFLSSPHQGTWAGLAAYPHRGLLRLFELAPYVRKITGESGLQLLPGSTFLKQLNSRPLPEGIQFSSIFYALDPMIWPPTNAILPYPEARNFFVRRFGHAHPLYCAEAARIVVEELFGRGAELAEKS